MPNTKTEKRNVLKGALKAASNFYSAFKGKRKRLDMFDAAVEREVRKRHGGGQPLAYSPQNKPLYDEVRKELREKLTKKNPKLLD